MVCVTECWKWALVKREIKIYVCFLWIKEQSLVRLLICSLGSKKSHQCFQLVFLCVHFSAAEPQGELEKCSSQYDTWNFAFVSEQIRSNRGGHWNAWKTCGHLPCSLPPQAFLSILVIYLLALYPEVILTFLAPYCGVLHTFLKYISLGAEFKCGGHTELKKIYFSKHVKKKVIWDFWKFGRNNSWSKRGRADSSFDRWAWHY